MSGIDYLEDALQTMNTGAANLNSKTLAQINAMNIELKNADGSLAGKYKLSEFLENVIYSYLTTTKASALASVLGVTCVVGPIAADKKINSNDDLNQLTLRASYRCQSASISKTVVNMPETASTNYGFSVINIKPYGDTTAFETQIFIQLDGIWIRNVNNMSTPYTWTEWKKIAFVS